MKKRMHGYREFSRDDVQGRIVDGVSIHVFKMWVFV